MVFSLFQRDKKVDLSPYIRRICDLTAPSWHCMEEGRTDKRYDRVIPVFVCPWRDEQPDLQQSLFLLTRDISDRGIGLLHTEPMAAKLPIVIGFWIAEQEQSEPWLFRAKVQISRPIGAGYWIIGTELDEYLNSNHRAVVNQIGECAARLLPTAVDG